jgi:hypothetical protein
MGAQQFNSILTLNTELADPTGQKPILPSLQTPGANGSPKLRALLLNRLQIQTTPFSDSLIL